MAEENFDNMEVLSEEEAENLYKNLADSAGISVQKLKDDLYKPISRWQKIKRRLRLWKQRRTRGWDDSDTWSLDYTIAKFVLPRLKRFKELNNGFPQECGEKGWNIALSDMIYALEICADEERAFGLSDDVDWDRVSLGLRLFGKHFRDLWW